MSDYAEIERLRERVASAERGIKAMKMTQERTQNLLAHKLKADCDENGTPFPIIGDFYRGVKHLVAERFFNPLATPFPEDDYLAPATRMGILKWCEVKEALIADDKPLFAFGVYMSILARPFIQGRRNLSEPKKGNPVLIFDEQEMSTEEKHESLIEFHRLYRKANTETMGVVFSELMKTVNWFSELEEKEQLKFVEKHSFEWLLLNGTPFAPNTFDFIKESGYLEIPDKARTEHMHVIAKSGHGKTQLLENFIFNDIMRAHDENIGLCVIDGQADLIKHIKNLKALSPLQDRVIIINPSDTEYPFCLNPFDIASSLKGDLKPAEKEEMYNSAIFLLEYVFSSLGSSMTAKQKVIFNFMVRLLVTIEGATLLTMKELLEDSSDFIPHYENLDQLSKDFFIKQFDSPTFTDTKYQILTRLYSILTNPALAKMFSAKTNQLDLYEEMNRGAIILVDTDKNLLKDDGHSLLGRFFLALIIQSATKRKFIEEDERTPFFVYIDECHDYMDGNITTMLAQARKNKVGLVMAHQFYDQLELKLKASLKTNTSIKLYGSLSAKDRLSGAKEIDVSEDKLKGLKSIDREGAEYLIKVGNDEPVKVFTPFGIMANAGKIEPEVLDYIIKKNRDKYCTDSPIASNSTLPPESGLKNATADTQQAQKEKPAPSTEETSFNLDDIEDL